MISPVAAPAFQVNIIMAPTYCGGRPLSHQIEVEVSNRFTRRRSVYNHIITTIVTGLLPQLTGQEKTRQIWHY